MIKYKSKLLGLFAAAVALTIAFVAPVDARRGGSFGSRGMRTYSAPPATATAPRYVTPVQRSMTERPPLQSPAAAYGQQYPAGRPGLFGGFGGGMLGGLLAGGLIGGMMGHGWGSSGGGGLLSLLLQIAIIGGIVWLALKFFRRPAAAVEAPSRAPSSSFDAGAITAGPWGATPQQFSMPVSKSAQQIPINRGDEEAFERLLINVQDAFGREDYGRLREMTTPEVMSYLAEELSQNATHGRRNSVTGTRLIQSDISEAWREGNAEYATVALRYESVDLMLDRTSGAVVEGDPSQRTEVTELWTFVRQAGGLWKLSAIQEA